MWDSGRGRTGGALRGGETRVAVASAAGLYATGALLIATSFLLPKVDSPLGAAGVALVALLTGGALMLAVLADRASLDLALAAELWGITIIVVLCASTGGAASPFALLYFFAVGHAAAFQPRNRVAGTATLGLLAFLAPLIYSTVSDGWVATACVGVVLALLTTLVVHLALERMRASRRRLELLLAATSRLDSSLDPQQTLRRIASTALPELAELCTIDLIDEDGSITATVAASIEPALALRVEELRSRQGPERFEDHPISRVLRSRTSCVIQDLSVAPVLVEALQSAGGEVTGEIPSRTVTVVPMVARGQMLGVISFVHRGKPRRGQLGLVEDLTGRAALAYDNARLYAERAHVARTLRSSLMPAALPTIDGLQLESYFRPMGSGNEVGGDFYDVFEDKESCWMVVGDVCGKGAEAAVLTSFLRHTTAAYAREGSGPGQVLSRVNSAMLEHDFDGRFATAILVRLTFGSGGVGLTVATAGHPAALLSRSDGGSKEFGEQGTLLGIFPDARIAESSTIMRAGDSLALYTDGLAEAYAPARLLSSGEMLSALNESPPGTAQEAIGTLLSLIDMGRGARDDIAILAMRIERPAASGAKAA
jgi:hypothetical protein